MAAASLVGFVFQAKCIVFYGSKASYNKHFICYLELLFELCILDVVVRASEAWTYAAQFPRRAGLQAQGKPLPLAFSHLNQIKLPLTCCLKLLISFVCIYNRYVRVRDD